MYISDIRFNASKYVAVFGETTSFTCLVENINNVETIAVTRGDMKEPVVTVYANGTSVSHLSHFSVTYEESAGMHTVGISFTAKCDDEAQYYCESFGSITAIDVSVQSNYVYHDVCRDAGKGSLYSPSNHS